MREYKDFYKRKYSGRYPDGSNREGELLFLVAARLNHLLSSKNIRYFFVKGIFLSRILYKEINMRPGKDIDIYIHPSDRYKVLRLFRQEGYDIKLGYNSVKSFYLPFNMDYQISEKGMTVDVHSFLEDVAGRDIYQYLNFKEDLDIRGIGFPVPDKRYHLYYSIHHALKHRFEYTGMFLDIIELYSISEDLFFSRKEKLLLKKALKNVKSEKMKPLKEGTITSYKKSFLVLNTKEKVRFIIKHMFLPFESLDGCAFLKIRLFPLLKSLKIVFRIFSILQGKIFYQEEVR